MLAHHYLEYGLSDRLGSSTRRAGYGLAHMLSVIRGVLSPRTVGGQIVYRELPGMAV